MATLDPNSTFQSWILSPEELKQGHIFSDTQRKAIQNYICQLANEKMNLTFIDENRQRDAELQGAIGNLRYLLELSDSYQKELFDESRVNNLLP